MTNKVFFLTHGEVCNLAVRQAFSSWGRAGRVVSGLLKHAAKQGVPVRTHCGRVSGSCVWYGLTEGQLDQIRAEAIARGDVTLIG